MPLSPWPRGTLGLEWGDPRGFGGAVPGDAPAVHPSPGTWVITSLRAGHSFNLSHNEGPGRAGGTHPAPGFRGAPALRGLESTLGCCLHGCEAPPPPAGMADEGAGEAEVRWGNGGGRQAPTQSGQGLHGGVGGAVGVPPRAPPAPWPSVQAI